mgnify:CR=1 FL=1
MKKIIIVYVVFVSLSRSVNRAGHSSLALCAPNQLVVLFAVDQTWYDASMFFMGFDRHIQMIG